jgi:CheY-like chemotaxis protein
MMKRILVIDDNDAVRENTMELLQLSDYHVFGATHGREGLDKAKQCKPDLILCDMLMPGLDVGGWLKLLQLDSELKHIPLVFFSAGSLPHSVHRAFREMADDYLKKPFTEEDLLEVIHRSLNKSASA